MDILPSKEITSSFLSKDTGVKCVDLFISHLLRLFQCDLNRPKSEFLPVPQMMQMCMLSSHYAMLYFLMPLALHKSQVLCAK